MKIEHIAIWSKDIERLKAFYEKYFNAASGSKYTNPNKSYSSYFLAFSSGTRLELMHMPSIPKLPDSKDAQYTGYIHMAISTGSMEQVDQLTAQLKADGYKIMDGPRHSGDGYYESVVLDPDGNRIEIAI